MSNAIRYDSLLVRHLAAELTARYSGRPLEGASLDAERRAAALELDGDALLWRLHPTDGRITADPAARLPAPVPLDRRARIGAVHAPPDERIVIFDVEARRRRPGYARRIIVELMGNQWNVVAVDAEERIVAVLWRRTAGTRPLWPGRPYALPPASARRGLERPLSPGEWMTLLGAAPPAERGRLLIAEVAYTSPINAGAILGAAGHDGSGAAVEAAYERYLAVTAPAPAAPRILRPDAAAQPYPVALPGIPDLPCPTLLDAMLASAGRRLPAVAQARGLPMELLDRLRARRAVLDRRASRLEEELGGAEREAVALRRQGDLLLSQLHRVRRGMERATLEDFAGGAIEVDLDPSLDPAQNAQRLYEAARKRERAARRIPALLERATAERERIADLLSRATAGQADAAEVEALLGRGTEGPRAGAGLGPQGAPVLPYRAYRTSGGLEVRVGRSRKANDDLTFRHSSPNDIWLHARDVAGAHVILRWSEAGANPPGRDLAEAAVLAGLHSRARTSGTVAVDWTRRKYVRKPRKAPPGLVTIERAKTIFVEPDAAVERRLRID